MPRQQSEASHYLNIYKLTIEKKRLQQELNSLAQRRDRIQERLAALEQEVVALDHKASELREATTPATQSLSEPSSVIYPPATSETTDAYKTVTLDY